ncbi:hypothetical protein NQ036_03775 [Brevibacterium sp. 91QC2O2]|uniref:hypothetical protein n=1 Tax=Brevibacterium TaxID=1696 RepID=UPI00211BE95C|nr:MULTISPECIES: hypothetical protein [unclassified Brevibacterium]MCQ9367366.1 hypothetical protein [Brevibacterium sp. 91QC2O2]MCQ9384621.1 hypothetical protein [Brevibacterium sp. 68QC2CO]
MSDQPMPGHEDCPHDLTEEQSMNGAYQRVYRVCEHEHLEPVHAATPFDLIDPEAGPIVADHCKCCNRIITREEYR